MKLNLRFDSCEQISCISSHTATHADQDGCGETKGRYQTTMQWNSDFPLSRCSNHEFEINLLVSCSPCSKYLDTTLHFREFCRVTRTYWTYGFVHTCIYVKTRFGLCFMLLRVPNLVVGELQQSLSVGNFGTQH